MENFKGFEDCCLDICSASTIVEREFAGCNVSADQKCCPHSADGLFGCSATGARDARGCNGTLCVHERGDTRHHLTHDLFAYRAVCQQALFGDRKNVALNFIGVGNHPSFENLGTARNGGYGSRHSTTRTTFGCRKCESPLAQRFVYPHRQNIQFLAHTLYYNTVRVNAGLSMLQKSPSRNL